VTSGGQARAAAVRDGFDVRIEAGLLLVLLALGAWLRLRNLGALGLIVDEGTQALAVQGLLEHGVPRLPSGIVYARSAPFVAVQAAVASLRGLDEVALRLPSVLFGVACIAAVHALARTLFGRRVALVAAAFVALSAWEIELSRYGRFYTAFQASYALALLAFYRGFLRSEAPWRFAFVGAALLAISFHELGLLLATCFAIPLFSPAWPVRRRLVFLLGVLAVVLASLAYQRGVEMLTGAALLPPDLEHVAAIVDVGTPGRLRLHLPSPSLPDLGLLLEAARERTGWLLLLALAPAAASVHALRAAGRSGGGRTALPILAVWLAFAHQGALAALALLAHAVLFAASLRELATRRFFPAYGAIALCLAAWAWILVARADADWRSATLVIFGYPNVLQHFLYWFVLGWPVFTVVVLLACGALLQRLLRDRTDLAALFLLAALVLPLLAASFFRPYFEARYVFHLYPLLAIAYAWALVEASGRLGRRLRLALAPGAALTAAVVGLGFLVSQDVGRVTFGISERTYATARDPIRAVINWDLYAGFHQDHEGPSAWVRKRLGEADRVLVVGVPYMFAIYRFYVGQLDVVLGRPEDGSYQRRRGERIVDWVTGAEVVYDAETLAERARTAPGSAWLLFDDVLLGEDDPYLGLEVRRGLRDLAPPASFRGRDGVTSVRRLR
jgi:4-amino-4-deoxy-L-arabinose transferase-like glycosyltransferase